jgi:hypothetical protein
MARTVDDAIAELQALKKKSPKGGETLVLFGDGSPVRIILSTEVEEMKQKFPEPIIQFRLDRDRWKRAEAARRGRLAV